MLVLSSDNANLVHLDNMDTDPCKWCWQGLLKKYKDCRMCEVANFIEEGPSVMSLQYLGTGDGAIRGKLLPESLIIYAIVQVLHIQIHPL